MSLLPPRTSGLLRARRVLTLDQAQVGDAIWWQDGRVRLVGRAADLERKVPSLVPRYDLPGATVTPGFVDGHTHFAMWGLCRRRVQLAGAKTLEEAVGRVASAQPSQGWIQGQGWDANHWDRLPDRQALDSVQQVPVFLDSLDVHAAWVNSPALAAGGVTAATADPPGGRIVRDGNGEPTGLLLENAVELVRAHLPSPGRDLLRQVLIEAQAQAHRLGITGIHDVEGPDALNAFRALELDGTLRLRVLFHPPVARLGELLAQGARSGWGTEWLSLGGVKFFLDGSLGSRTAWMLDPYDGSTDRGMPVTSEAEAQRAMAAAAGAGISCTVHAIGDAAVRRALDLLEPLPRPALPHRIEHFQCVDPADLERAARAGIVASMQPTHILTDIPLAERHWGARSRGAYAFRSLLDRGTTLVFGSDVPVASLDPREGVFAAMERQDGVGAPEGGWYPAEKLDFGESVRAYTIGPALAGGISARRGTLAPGRDADLVAWDVDPALDRGVGEAFRSGCAILTVVGGEVMFQA